VARGRTQLHQSAVERKTSQTTRSRDYSQVVATLAQKKGWVWKRLRACPPRPQKPEYKQAKQADLLMLQLWAASGLICLKYLDETGFERCSSLNYSYSRQGQQKQVHQPRSRGKRLSALGVWQPQQGFDHGLVVGGFNTQRFLFPHELASQHCQGAFTPYRSTDSDCP